MIDLYALPYILFYIDIGLYFGLRDRSDLFMASKYNIFSEILSNKIK